MKYFIIVTLTLSAIVGMGALMFFGDCTRTLFPNARDALQGDTAPSQGASATPEQQPAQPLGRQPRDDRR